MKRTLALFLALLLLIACTGCAAIPPETPSSEGTQDELPSADEGGQAGQSAEDETQEGEQEGMKITVTVNGEEFTATLADGEAARAFAERLPMTLEMSELNGNEKYCYLDEGFPTATDAPQRIEAGDLMLYGSACVVLFYESFSTSYSYTRLGKIDDASRLAAAVGRGTATMTFASREG